MYLLELPRHLYKTLPNEKESIKGFWERERDQTIYVKDRFEVR